MLVANIPCTNLENATEVISGVCSRALGAQKLPKMGLSDIAHRHFVLGPQKSGKQDTCSSTGLLWLPCLGMLENLPTALLQLGLHIPVPQSSKGNLECFLASISWPFCGMAPTDGISQGSSQ